MLVCHGGRSHSLLAFPNRGIQPLRDFGHPGAGNRMIPVVLRLMSGHVDAVVPFIDWQIFDGLHFKSEGLVLKREVRGHRVDDLPKVRLYFPFAGFIFQWGEVPIFRSVFAKGNHRIIVRVMAELLFFRS